MRNAYNILIVGELEGKKPPGRRSRRWEYDTGMDFKEWRCEDVDWIHLDQNKVQLRLLWNTLISLLDYFPYFIGKHGLMVLSCPCVCLWLPP